VIKKIKAAFFSTFLAGISIITYAEDKQAIFNPSGNMTDAVTRLCPDNNKECLRSVISVRGDFFKALLIAYNDYFNKNKTELKKEKLSSFEKFYLISENNDFFIYLDEGYYFVNIGPGLRPEYPDIAGGWTVYKIDEKTYKIIDCRKTGR